VIFITCAHREGIVADRLLSRRAEMFKVAEAVAQRVSS